MRLPAAPRSRLLAACALSAYAMLACCACGATASHPGAGDSSARTFTAVGGASAASTPTVSPTAAEGPAACAETVAATLGAIAQRIYLEAGTGGNVEQAVHRLRSSTSLRAAASSGDARATAAALRSLLAGQIARVQVLRGGRVLASAGSGTAIAPVTGTLPGTGGAHFVLSVQSDRTYLQVTKQVTGAEVLLLSGTRRLAGTIAAPSGTISASGALKVGSREFQVASVSGAVYPTGALRIALLVPAAEIPSCPTGAAQTRAAVLGRVGERIYEEEAHSPYVAATIRHMEADGAFRAAVAARDPAATRRAIIGFFAAHIHVVRVRVTVDGKLLYDLGGPHVLAPVAGTLRQGGRVIGRFLMAIQDDAGYLKLAHLFTGGQVLMRTGATQVAGTLSPGPASVPDRGTVSYRGRSYQAFSFTGTAFPSGALRISLLF